MPSPPRKHRLSPEERQALESLASDPQGATEELLVLAHGFDSNMIAGLVHSGLAMARRENMKAGSRASVRNTVGEAISAALAKIELSQREGDVRRRGQPPAQKARLGKGRENLVGHRRKVSAHLDIGLIGGHR